VVVEDGIGGFGGSDSGEGPTGSTLSLVFDLLDFVWGFGPINGVGVFDSFVDWVGFSVSFGFIGGEVHLFELGIGKVHQGVFSQSVGVSFLVFLFDVFQVVDEDLESVGFFFNGVEVFVVFGFVLSPFHDDTGLSEGGSALVENTDGSEQEDGSSDC